MTEISSNSVDTLEENDSEETELEFFDPDNYPLDERTAKKLSEFRYYAREELIRRMDDISGFLIDCQHKNWSGVLASLTETRIDLEGEPLDPAEAVISAPAVSIEFETKSGETFSLTTRLDGAENLAEKVKRVFITVVAGLDKAAEAEEENSDEGEIE